MTTNSIPIPYVAKPTNEWDGIDGKWSTFRISIGSEPGQDFRVLVSTQAAAALVPVAEGCMSNDTECPELRGMQLFDGQPRPFQMNLTETWTLEGIYSLDLEDPLNYPDDAGYFGFDKVRLGFGEDKDAMEVNRSLAVGYAAPSYWIGLLGLNNAQTNLASESPIPSLIQVLNNTGKIPSLSYGYTAGAQYRYKSVPGSLVIGGYDKTRFKPPVYSFAMANAGEEMLAVEILSISTHLTGLGAINLADSHMSAIDSTISQLWLPEDACNNFAMAFGLTYDNDSNYYLINETMQSELRTENPILTFKLSDGKENSDSTNNIQIELPYAAFDLTIGPPAYSNETRYFPIRRARDGAQTKIGRVFLQEAYLVVDYERKNFSLAQANFTLDMPEPQIQTVYSTQYIPGSVPQSGPSSSLSNGAKAGIANGAKAGIAIGAAIGVLLLLSSIYIYWWRPRGKAMMHKTAPELQPDWHKAELPTGTENQVKRPELDADNGVYELNGVSDSCELSVPGGGREVQGVVYEMDASHELTSTIREESRSRELERVEVTTPEQRGVSEQRSASGVEGPSS